MSAAFQVITKEDSQPILRRFLYFQVNIFVVCSDFKCSIVQIGWQEPYLVSLIRAFHESIFPRQWARGFSFSITNLAISFVWVIFAFPPWPIVTSPSQVSLPPEKHTLKCKKLVPPCERTSPCIKLVGHEGIKQLFAYPRLSTYKDRLSEPCGYHNLIEALHERSFPGDSQRGFAVTTLTKFHRKLHNT